MPSKEAPKIKIKYKEGCQGGSMNIQTIEKTISLKLLAESETRKGSYYIVEYDGEIWTCTCPDCANRVRACKHIKEAQKQYSIELNP